MPSYSDKIILAPMVRVGTLPMRLLAIDYGADLVYTEEIIDYRLLKCKRIENRVLSTVDFIDDDQNVVFRTCHKERNQVVLQLGTCCPERALKAAKMVENDVCGIDINMGCPKEFSIKGGMGAALLTQPDKVKNILSTLINIISCPITCKIRVLPELDDTLALCKLIESSGAAALAVHGRTREERQQHKNRNYVIYEIAKALSIPVIANGGSSEITCYSDIEAFRKETGASSVMLARQAEWNCSIFRKDGKLPLDDVIVSYIKHAIDYDNNVFNTKYCVQQMLGSLQESERGKALLSAQQMETICDLWNLRDYFISKRNEINSQIDKLQRLQERDFELQACLKRRRVDDIDIYEMDIKFIRSLFSMDGLPKTVLWNWTVTNNYKQPCYKTEQYEKSFQSIVLVNGKRYTNRCLQKNKKQAEQAAALAACLVLNLITNDKLEFSIANNKNILEIEHTSNIQSDIVRKEKSTVTLQPAELRVNGAVNNGQKSLLCDISSTKIS